VVFYGSFLSIFSIEYPIGGQNDACGQTSWPLLLPPVRPLSIDQSDSLLKCLFIIALITPLGYTVFF
jgi:hypothetical protein